MRYVLSLSKRQMKRTKVRHVYDYKMRGESAVDIIVWCRNNLGERGKGWDFTIMIRQRLVIIEIWDERLEVTWNLFKE